MLDEGGPHGRHETEVDEHEEFTKAVVAIGPGAAGVEPTGQNRAHAHQHQPPRRPGREPHPRYRGHGEAPPRGMAHDARRHELRGRQSERTHAIVVGATNPVGVVVRKVGRDLQRQRHYQTQGRVQPVDGGGTNQGRAEHDGHARSRQGSRSCRHHPASRRRGDVAHGRLGNFEKSGFRRSR